MDSKKSLQDSVQTNSNLEQESFGNQPPFASTSSTHPNKVDKDIFGSQSPYTTDADQEIFANQPPYAAGSSALPDHPQDYLDHRKHQQPADEEAPYLALPYQPHMMPTQKAIHPTAPFSGADPFLASSFPSEAPPMYSTVTQAPIVPPAPSQSLQSPHGADRLTLPSLQTPEISPRTIRSLPSVQQTAPRPPGLPTDHASTPYPTQPSLHEQQQQPQQQHQQQLAYPYAPQSYGAVSPRAPSTPRQSRSLRRQGSNSSNSSTGSSDSEDSEDDQLLPRGQRKNKYPIRCKKGKSKCSKRNIFLAVLTGTLIYYFFFVIMVDPCEAAKRLETEEETYSFAYSENTTMSLSILDDIPGSILVKENEDWGAEVILVSVFSTSADHSTIDDIFFDYFSFPNLDVIQWVTRLQSWSGQPEKLLKRIKRTCTRSDTVITLPRGYTGVRSINLLTSQGDIRVQWQSSQSLTEEISLHVTGGSVVLDGLSTKTKTDIVVSGVGSVSGVLTTTEQVNISTDVGHIDLELDTEVGLVGDPPRNLDVSLSTKKKGHINFVHTRDYSGHFALNSGLGSAVFMYPSDSSMPVFTKKSNAHIEGWITEDGSKPSRDIPVVKASTYEGSISMTILDSSVPRGHTLEELELKD